MGQVALIGCGFVADLYMRSLAVMPGIEVTGAWDRDAARLAAFCAHWGVVPAASQEALLQTLPETGVVLNLTNPASHYAVNRDCLDANRHVYCEKPLAMEVSQAIELRDLADARGLMLASAPCSMLGEAAQTLGHALRAGIAGTPRLVYAELDDGFIPQAPYGKWVSESGAPWPARDEFNVGCTLEHAGYYLGWLISWFGPVRRVVAASSETIPGKPGADGTPDFSTATLFFHDGPVTRLTCSIAAPHDHRIRIVGDAGVLSCKAAWDNRAAVRFARRMVVRRRLMESPWPRRIRLSGPTHPKVGRWGAASMNFMLGPAEMLEALKDGRESRLSNDFALHLTEVSLAIQNAGEDAGAQDMLTTCTPMEPMPWAR